MVDFLVNVGEYNVRPMDAMGFGFGKKWWHLIAWQYDSTFFLIYVHPR